MRSYSSVLPPELLTALTAECHAVADHDSQLPPLANGKYRTHWLPRGRRPRFAVEEAIHHLLKLVRPPAATVGAEWWVQRVARGDRRATPIGWHVDKDEAVASHDHYLLHPALGSIMYLTDEGGPTVITDQWSPHGSGYTPERPREGAVSFPQRNKYTVFHGELLHGVLAADTPAVDRSTVYAHPPIGASAGSGEAVATRGAAQTHLEAGDGTRLTFLVNWWSVKPREPNCVELDPAAVRGLPVWSRAQLAQFRASLTHPLRPAVAHTAAADSHNHDSTAVSARAAAGGVPAPLATLYNDGGAEHEMRYLDREIALDSSSASEGNGAGSARGVVAGARRGAGIVGGDDVFTYYF